MDEEIKKILEDHEIRIKKLEEILGRGKPEVIEKKISLREFIRSKKPKDDVEKTLVIGYYLEKFENYRCFNKKDLEAAYRKAKEMVPININDKVNLNIKKGFIMEAEEKKDGLKAWVVTSSGEDYVEKEMGNE